MQTWASVNHGYWYARSSEFLDTPLMQTLRWMRVPGDSLFAIGAFILVTFVFTLKSRRSQKEAISPDVVLVSVGD
jgi:nitric oxide reductase subunit B